MLIIFKVLRFLKAFFQKMQNNYFENSNIEKLLKVLRESRGHFFGQCSSCVGSGAKLLTVYTPLKKSDSFFLFIRRIVFFFFTLLSWHARK